MTWTTLLIVLLDVLTSFRFASAVDISTVTETFVSRPDIRALRFNTKIHDPSSITPGYWFVSFYHDNRDHRVKQLAQTAQVGPHIYDGLGNLVWSGASLFPRRMTYDLRVSNHGGSDQLSFLLDVAPSGVKQSPSYDPISLELPQSAAIFLNNSYGIRKHIPTYRAQDNTWFNMHELNVVNDGLSALVVMGETRSYNTTEENGVSASGYVTYNGFMELDLETGEALYSWMSVDHIPVSESFIDPPENWESGGAQWDYLHINSVDKNEQGDYLISGRYTSCVYKISGQDGRILWRLGGKKSSFYLDGFNFSSQHDARYIDEDGTTTTISLFDNAWSEIGRSATQSTALVVSLDTTTSHMTARSVKHWGRPDGSLTFSRGNFQLLANGNAFVGYSRSAYLSEHTPDGRCVLEAQLAVPDVATYRTYKFNFTGYPDDQPALRSISHTIGPSSPRDTVVHHVSWNGATEVRSWKFYGSKRLDPSKMRVIGHVQKNGFETVFVSAGPLSTVQVEALDKNGQVLGMSSVHEPEVISSAVFKNSEHVTWTSHTFWVLLSLTLVGLVAVCIMASRFRLPSTFWKPVYTRIENGRD